MGAILETAVTCSCEHYLRPVPPARAHAFQHPPVVFSSSFCAQQTHKKYQPRAREMFRDMRAQGINPSPQATAALIRALARAGGDSDEAVSLLADMRAADSRGRGRRGRAGGEDGDGQTEEAVVATEAQSAGFSGAIEACAAAGEWQKAVSLLDEMRLVSWAIERERRGGERERERERGHFDMVVVVEYWSRVGEK